MQIIFQTQFDKIFVSANIVAATSAFVLSAVTGTLPEHQSLEPSVVRPRCSSILHLFGPWLFEAAFIGSEFAKHFASKETGTSGHNTTPSAGVRRPNEMGMNQTITPRPAGLCLTNIFCCFETLIFL